MVAANKLERWVRSNMKQRCSNRNHKDYDRYGGRGIAVCERWRSSFDCFLADMGERPRGTTLDRIDNNGNYEPDNCKWATRSEQANNRSSNRIVVFRGAPMPLSVAARASGLTYSVVKARLDLGWTLERAISEPVNKPSDRKRDSSGLFL